MTSRYRVVVVGMGKRGMHHATAFAANPRFELVGHLQQRSEAARRRRREARRSVKSSTDARQLARETSSRTSSASARRPTCGCR